MSWQRFQLLGCTHGSIIDREAEKVARNFMDDWKPKHRVHLGDLWEFSALRKGASPEEKKEKLSYDINCGFELLDWFKPQKLTLGNHDFRLWRAAKEAASDSRLAELLAEKVDDTEERLRKRKIQVTPWGVKHYTRFHCGGPRLLHGYRSTMYPAKAHFENWGECITAHVHKPDTHISRHVDGGTAHCIGTLANLDKLSYADGTPAKLGWRNSFGYGLINSKTGKWQMWHVIKEGDDWVSPHGII